MRFYNYDVLQTLLIVNLLTYVAINHISISITHIFVFRYKALSIENTDNYCAMIRFFNIHLAKWKLHVCGLAYVLQY